MGVVTTYAPYYYIDDTPANVVAALLAEDPAKDKLWICKSATAENIMAVWRKA